MSQIGACGRTWQWYLIDRYSMATRFGFCRFSPAVIQKIGEEVVHSVLDGKEWSGEEETVWTVSITEQIKARVKGE